ncbi:MAG: septation protein SpoVG family protein [Planctomycetes bacterium]|nr:septation protein SpoVG family protein [Planctomycetota bacterium]
MDITEVKVKLMPRHQTDKLKAFCSITIDNEFVVRDLKVIEGSKGMFVAMPSRKITDHCLRCGCKNDVIAKFCCECGAKLNANRAEKDEKGRAKIHTDIAHPINGQCREKIREKVIRSFRDEVDRSKQPGYTPKELDDVPPPSNQPDNRNQI